jgi:hypothetical protein
LKELRALQIEQPLAFGEIEQAIARKKPDRGHEPRQIPGREEHDVQKGRKRARLRLPLLARMGDIYA